MTLPLPPLPLMPASEEEIDALGSAALEISFTLSSHVWTVVGRLAPVPGAKATLPSGQTLAVGSAQLVARQMLFRLHHRWTPGSTRLPARGSDELLARYSFVLASRTYDEFLVGPPSGSSLPDHPRRLVGGAELHEHTIPLGFLAVSGGRAGEPLADDWFDDVEILVLERVDQGAFEVDARWEVEEWPRLGRSIRVGREGVVTVEGVGR